ncbi:efflux transporter periplasmic adaptor subunit [Bacterioplanes sanyensis]|uniref:Efflux transporter periplasmic adaptor subunit n=1 Tax=Bacterioplanes sanyensis TaxID=1249553 RepID=A0A222FKJ7_9GAMM|nr:efflux RND transporter periplasmic adaptor subunit [Bacterioplanes sanyensis]ASP39555.1 efflux transporter periplasmic adaptor subunit [Bacterioplanes sanyensis]
MLRNLTLTLLLASPALALAGDDHSTHSQDGHDHASHVQRQADDHDHSTDAHAQHNDHNEQPDHNHGDHQHSDEHSNEHSESEHAEHHHDSDKHNDEHNENEHADHSHDDGHGDDDHASAARLSPQQQQLAELSIAPLQRTARQSILRAPGEIVANAYQTYVLSPRTDSSVVARHVALGEHVRAGQVLVTLFSADVASAQASYRQAHSEWQRVQQLGRNTVGEQRYTRARSDYEQGLAQLRAFGLSPADIKTLQSNEPQQLGQYQLRAQVNGTVLSDDFEQGQHLAAGTALMRIANEQQLWVEVHLPATDTLPLSQAEQLVVIIGDQRIPARLGQDSHSINPITRTRTVRLEIDNPEHRFHPGMFASAELTFTSPPVLAVPSTALMPSSDGHWQVFVQTADDTFSAQEVELGQRFGDWQQVHGVAEGARLVMQGAFFVASQLAKDGFDPHNH